MAKLAIKEIRGRLGRFCIIKLGRLVLMTPCDTRMLIIRSLAERAMNAEELAEQIGVSYSTIMDHMDILERASIVKSFLKREDGKRRIYFELNEEPEKGLLQLLGE